MLEDCELIDLWNTVFLPDLLLLKKKKINSVVSKHLKFEDRH